MSGKPDEHSIILTTEQLAQRWGMSPRTLEGWRSENKGPDYIKLGEGKRSAVFYRLTDVMKFEAEKIRATGDK